MGIISPFVDQTWPSEWHGFSAQAEVLLMIKMQANGYIWTNLESEYLLKSITTEAQTQNVKHLVKKFGFPFFSCYVLYMLISVN